MSGYIEAAAKRASLPVEVTYLQRLDRWLVVDMTDRRRWLRTPDASVALRFYLALCSQLSQTPPPPGATAGASAPAHSIRSAAASSAEPPADTAASGTAVAAEPPIPGSAAPLSEVRP